MGSNEQSEEHGLMIEGSEVESSMQIDPKRSRFPYCIVWAPLPVISWFFPCIGHVGICREDGVILDFAGPNFVCVDNFTFGEPTRYLQLSREQCCAFLDSAVDDQGCELAQTGERGKIVTWDDALHKATQEYQHRTYNILTCNCHSFVSNCLNRLKFQARDWNVVNLAIFMLIKGKFVDKLAIAKTFVPFMVVFLVGLAIGGDTFLLYLAILIFILVGWFLIGSYCVRKLIHV